MRYECSGASEGWPILKWSASLSYRLSRSYDAADSPALSGEFETGDEGDISGESLLENGMMGSRRVGGMG